MAEFVLAVMAVAATLYAVLGGADFGAGMIEPLLGERGSEKVDAALLPVWEANHVWLVVLVVLAFVGFPPLFTLASTYLHVPLALVLLGIVGRGSAFTFRHYDPEPGRLDTWYTWVFRASSLLTPLFLGVIAAALLQGTLTTAASASFYEAYVAPWNTAFCWATGVFACSLFAFEGAALLSAEEGAARRAHGAAGPLPRLVLARRLHLLAIATGGVVLWCAYRAELAWLEAARTSAVSIGALVLATLLTPAVALAFRRGAVWTLRLSAGAQVMCVLVGFFGARYPELLLLRGDALTLDEAAAPPATLRALVWALAVGLLLILPSLAYLLRVYKRPNGSDESVTS